MAETKTIWLMTADHKLNYDEVVRRLLYWSGYESIREADHRLTALRSLAEMLEQERNNLHFEEDKRD
jgi:hypothetical protein